MAVDPNWSVGSSFISSWYESAAAAMKPGSLARARPEPKRKGNPKAPKRRAPAPNLPAAGAPQRGSAATLPRAQTVMLQGIADGKMLGDCSLSLAMGTLMVELQRAGKAAGGMFAVDSLPIGEWIVLADPRGFLLPVAIQRTRMDAYCVRMDRQPLQGLRTLPSQPGWVPSPHASAGRTTPQQQRQNDQMAIRALDASGQAKMNTARHVRF